MGMQQGNFKYKAVFLLFEGIKLGFSPPTTGESNQGIAAVCPLHQILIQLQIITVFRWFSRMTAS